MLNNSMIVMMHRDATAHVEINTTVPKVDGNTTKEESFINGRTRHTLHLYIG